MNERLTALITEENARQYLKEQDKLVFCADVTGLRIDSAELAKFEDALESLAVSLAGQQDNPGKAGMLHYNVICRRRGHGNDQFLCGNSQDTARKTATAESSNLHKGESVILWSIDDKTKIQSEIVCVG